MNRRWGLVVCAALWMGAATVRAECDVTPPAAPVHLGVLGTFEASGPEVSARLAERVVQVGITCRKGVAYRLRVKPARDGVLMGDVVHMVNADGGPPLAMAVVLEAVDGTRVQRRFSALPQARYEAVGTGLPQLALLRLEPVDVAGQKRMGRRERMAPGHYRVELRLEIEPLGTGQANAGPAVAVPLEFTLNVAPPVCSLTLGGGTASSLAQPASVLVDLTPTPLSVLNSPNGIVKSLPGTSAIASSGPGLLSASFPGSRKLDAPPVAFVACTAGTLMTARVTATFSATHASLGPFFMAGSPGAGQASTLPVGMLMGIESFAGVSGASGASGTTYSGKEPSVTALSTGMAQPLTLTAAFYANSAAPLSAAHAGLWTYRFNVNLDF